MVSGKKGIYEENGGVNVKRIVCIGDSNTYGYDPRSFAGSRYPEGVRWTGILKAAGFEVINLGQNGLCIPPKVQFRLFQDMIRSYMPADVIIVMLGSNDLLNGSTVSEAAEKMSAFLQACKEAAPDSALLLVAPPPMQVGEWVQTKDLIEKSLELGKTYRALAERQGVLFADSGRWEIPLTYDGVHFTEEGHRRFAEGIAAALS